MAILGLGGCATLPENLDRATSYAVDATHDTRLGRLEQAQKDAHPEQSGFLLLDDGLDAFLARAVLAELAERSIDAQYYLLHDDLTGRLFASALVKAADRGVRVRLLVDDMDLDGRDFSFVLLDAHPGIEVRIFNPFSRKVGRASQFLTRLGTVTRRMHNKSFTADNQVTVLGGRNIGDEYFEANPQLAFQDLDVLAIGVVPQEVSDSFDSYWNHPLAYPVQTLVRERPTPEQVVQARRDMEAFVAAQADSAYLAALRDSALARRLRAGEVDFGWGQARVVADSPEKLVTDRDQAGAYRLLTELTPYFKGITSELIIFSPYFVPGRAGTAFLAELCKRGVRVRILTNSLASTDVAVVHAGYARYRRDLLRAGVELYELDRQMTRQERREKQGTSGSSAASLHAKSFVLDRQRVFIGSMNLDPRSVVENSEIGVMLEQPGIAGGMAEWFDRHIESLAFRVRLEAAADGTESLRWYGMQDGATVTFDHEPHTGFWRRFGIGLMRLLPVESQL
jgi:putative cardiolipin synthase